MKPLSSGTYKSFSLPFTSGKGQVVRGLSLTHGRPPQWWMGRGGGDHKDLKMQRCTLPPARIVRRKAKAGGYHRHGELTSPKRGMLHPHHVPILVPVPRDALLVIAWYFFPALFVPADAAASSDHGVGGAGRLPEPHGSLCCGPDATDGGSEHERPGGSPHDTNLR